MLSKVALNLRLCGGLAAWCEAFPSELDLLTACKSFHFCVRVCMPAIEV
jgi:hypothetical protein